jgi:peptidoglycan/LPS O-acetylase OafA/YrhL
MEGLRGLAVLLVCPPLLDPGAAAGPSRSSNLISAALKSYGNVGVELFFVLSGYLIYGW